MKLVNHPGVPKPTSLTLGTNPLVIWLSKTTELHIQRGDDLGMIITILRKHGLNRPDTPKIAAFYFAIGERQHTQRHAGNFKKSELSIDPKRRYLASKQVR